MRLSLLGSGAGSTVAAVLDAVADGRIAADAALVVSNNSGAGVLDVAAAHGVPTAHLSSVTHPDPAALDAAVLAALDAAGTDLVVLAGYMKKLGPLTLAAYDGRVVNVHPALLPAYGGQGMYGDRVHAAVLADGAAVSGATVHLVTAGYDEGPVLAQVEVPVEPDDSVEALRARVQAAEKRLLVEWLSEWSRS
ncbi:phosphoribosylglycinamide formyltransferase [Nocardioides islandensis]|uniref:Phosphoribosylglycinamide formyltransferase n=1 Tax=Nocardioides islandensis TaxID=433663 RepID=A0A930VCK1_9ACTN|nr:phosphoribosylglycinamide formyltransferase [Nocardioides islandensis]MBF4762112.1 phosphoribosylglycinamide formyltransferase [Nocardioides islandensis]